MDIFSLLSLLLLLVVIVIAIGYLLTYPPAYKSLFNMPGPPKKWVIGNVLDIKPDTAELTATFMKWYDLYGSPLLVKIGPFHSVHIFKASHVEKILKHTVNIKKSRDYRFMEPWLGDGLLFSSGKKWHQRRKLLTPTFHFQILKDFMPIFNRQALTMAQVLSELPQVKNGEAFDISRPITLCTLDIICETAMGKAINAQRQSESQYVQAICNVGQILMYRVFRPWLWLPSIFNITPIGKNCNKSIQILHSFTMSVIEEREAEYNRLKTSHQNVKSNDYEPKKRQAFLDLLLEMKHNGEITMEGVREEVDTFMFEGHDTTSTGLMWAIHLIGSYPAVQQKLFEEIENVYGSDRNADVGHEQINSLHYLDQVLKESQRLLPSVPIVVREVIEPFEIDGYTIPVGTGLNISFLALHRNPEFFPDPLKFDPERFSPDNVDGRHPFAFTPFSGGLRNCIGQKFAVLEEKVLLVHLIRHFRFESCQKFEDLQPCMELVLRPGNGIWVKLTPRL